MECLKWKVFQLLLRNARCFGLFMPKYQTFAHVSRQISFRQSLSARVAAFGIKSENFFDVFEYWRVQGEIICASPNQNTSSGWCCFATNRRLITASWMADKSDSTRLPRFVFFFWVKSWCLNLFIWIWSNFQMRFNYHIMPRQIRGERFVCHEVSLKSQLIFELSETEPEHHLGRLSSPWSPRTFAVY